MGEKKEKRKRREKREGFEREKLYLLSRFLDDRSGKLRLGKNQSWSPLQELRVGTGIGEFRKTTGGRGSSPTFVVFGLRVIQMEWMV